MKRMRVEGEAGSSPIVPSGHDGSPWIRVGNRLRALGPARYHLGQLRGSAPLGMVCLVGTPARYLKRMKRMWVEEEAGSSPIVPAHPPGAMVAGLVVAHFHFVR